MRGDSAPGKDGISINKIKKSIADILAHIINNILDNSIIPDSFKIVVITLLHKG
jgi:hypothetical protein